MPEKNTSAPPREAALVRPCVCCRAAEHHGLPDRDLQGYVCRDCAPLLRGAAHQLHLAGYPACLPTLA